MYTPTQEGPLNAYPLPAAVQRMITTDMQNSSNYNPILPPARNQQTAEGLPPKTNLLTARAFPTPTSPAAHTLNPGSHPTTPDLLGAASSGALNPGDSPTWAQQQNLYPPKPQPVAAFSSFDNTAQQSITTVGYPIASLGQGAPDATPTPPPFAPNPLQLQNSTPTPLSAHAIQQQQQQLGLPQHQQQQVLQPPANWALSNLPFESDPMAHLPTQRDSNEQSLPSLNGSVDLDFFLRDRTDNHTGANLQLNHSMAAARGSCSTGFNTMAPVSLPAPGAGVTSAEQFHFQSMGTAQTIDSVLLPSPRPLNLDGGLVGGPLLNQANQLAPGFNWSQWPYGQATAGMVYQQLQQQQLQQLSSGAYESFWGRSTQHPQQHQQQHLGQISSSGVVPHDFLHPAQTAQAAHLAAGQEAAAQGLVDYWHSLNSEGTTVADQSNTVLPAGNGITAATAAAAARSGSKGCLSPLTGQSAAARGATASPVGVGRRSVTPGDGTRAAGKRSSRAKGAAAAAAAGAIIPAVSPSARSGAGMQRGSGRSVSASPVSEVKKRSKSTKGSGGGGAKGVAASGSRAGRGAAEMGAAAAAEIVEEEDEEEEYNGEEEGGSSSSSDRVAPAAKRVRNVKGKKVNAPAHKPAMKNGINATSGYKGVTR